VRAAEAGTWGKPGFTAVQVVHLRISVLASICVAEHMDAVPVSEFVTALAAKQPTPGGGAAAAVGAAIGSAAACMAAAYTTRKKDKESGAAAAAEGLIGTLDINLVLAAADDDAAAYADLQRSWKDSDMSAEEKAAIEARALAVPVALVNRCHTYILAIKDFLPVCNPNITSDAKVGIHQLAGAARAAYQTALVNSPAGDVRERLRTLLSEIRDIEEELLELGHG
jgi:methenyltetrahydrofolate cyclohydrolase